MQNNQDHIIQSASILKAIGHPIRIKIIIALAQKNKMTVTELFEELHIDQPVMSLHLAILRKKNIIQSVKKGKKSYYSISNNSVKQIVTIAYHSSS